MKNKNPVDPASDELLKHLAGIARSMLKPLKTETTKGKVVKRKLSTGVSYRYVMEPGLNAIGLDLVHVRVFRELGSILSRIVSGEDARTLFRQNELVKPSKKSEHQSRALAYWSTRALNPSANDEQAVRTANDVVRRPKNLTAATIRKIAQRHRQDCMWLLAQGLKLKDPKVVGGKTIKLRRPAQIAKLQKYLRKKSARLEQ